MHLVTDFMQRLRRAQPKLRYATRTQAVPAKVHTTVNRTPTPMQGCIPGRQWTPQPKPHS